jgi:hypothetical protein
MSKTTESMLARHIRPSDCSFASIIIAAIRFFQPDFPRGFLIGFAVEGADAVEIVAGDFHKAQQERRASCLI